jgi:hypothetical protein
MSKSLFILSCLISIALSYIYTVPCGRCVGKGDVCLYDQCGPDLKCVSINGGAKVCLDVIKKGLYCDGITEFDACENDFFCDRADTKTCIPSGGFAGYNDACLDDKYCVSGLSCKKGLCKETNFTECQSDNACPRNKYCRRDIDFPRGICTNMLGSGANCTLEPCKDGLVCNSDTKTCKEYFTLNTNENCSSTIDCKTGLICSPNDDFVSVCSAPKYFLLGIGSSAWGQECIPGSGAGCKCHGGSKVFQYHKETRATYTDACKASIKAYTGCMDTRNCKYNTGSDSCLRKNCYDLLKRGLLDCSESTLLGQGGLSLNFCGASNIVLIFVLMILAILV